MRAFQRNALARLLIAAAVGTLVTLIAWRAGALALAVLLFIALVIVVFSVLTIAPDAIALRRKHYWRWWWRSTDEEGPFWPGTRIPRSPKPPRR
jgi:hypothetical protein